MRNVKKFLILIVFFVLLFTIVFQNVVYCDTIDDIISGMDGTQKGDPSDNTITKRIDTIFSLIRYVGTGISIVMVMVLAIKYMISSAEEKAELKKKAIPVLVGCTLIFATTNLISIINDIVTDL